jgi:hypothetical protein
MKGLLASIALLMATGMAVADPRVATASDQTQVDSFDNWEISRGLQQHSYLLIAQSRDHDGRFWLNCDSNGFFNVAIPVENKDGRDRLRSFTVIISSDRRDRHELNLVVFENFIAVALDYEGGRSDKLATFLETLRTSEQTFTISYGGRVFEFDTAKFPAAQARFAQLCRHRVALDWTQ